MIVQNKGGGKEGFHTLRRKAVVECEPGALIGCNEEITYAGHTRCDTEYGHTVDLTITHNHV